MDFIQRRTLIHQKFQDLYRRPPEIWSRAPGRVDLMGSHTDYNEGFVLTQAIDRDTWLAARPRSDRKVQIASLNVAGLHTFDLDDIRSDPGSPWVNYVRGVALVLQKQGFALSGFDGLLHSTVPFGSGLSSSAALEVSTAIMFDLLGGWNIDPVQLAKFCQQAENDFVGMRCGILDQYSSLMGRADQVLLLDCRTLQSETKPVAGNLQVVICDTRAVRALTGSEYPERRAQCEQGARILAESYPQINTLRDASLDQLEAHDGEMPDVVARRCRFIIEENNRVLALAEALADADTGQIRTLMDASYAGARDLFEISCPEMEFMYAAMTSGPEVIGARQAGAGFGGCMVAILHQNAVEDFSAHVMRQYQASSGIEPGVYPVRASVGAGRLAF